MLAMLSPSFVTMHRRASISCLVAGGKSRMNLSGKDLPHSSLGLPGILNLWAAEAGKVQRFHLLRYEDLLEHQTTDNLKALA